MRTVVKGVPLPSVVFLVILVLVSSIAFIIGRFTADPPAAAATSGVSAGDPKLRTAGEGSSSGAFTRVETPAVLTGEQAQARMFELLSIPDRVERTRQLCELLRGVTRENWRAVMDSFIRHQVTTGRRNREELNLILQRAGAVAGSAALEEALASEKSHERGWASLLLTGWAEAEPKAALDWIATQPPEKHEQFARPLITGIGRSDPLLALRVVSNDLQDLRDNLVPYIVEGVIQRGGFREAEEMLAKMAGSQEIVPRVQGAFFWEAAVRQVEMVRLRGEPSSVLDWADQYLSGAFSGPSATNEIVTCAAQADPVATMKWVEARKGRLTPEQEAVAYPVIALEMLSKDPQQLAEWMTANAEHPQHDKIARLAAQHFLQGGNLENATQWAQVIADPAARQAMELKISKVEETRRNGQAR